MQRKYDAIALFSGGLDSILAVKTVEAQGLRVKCLHFVSPFFGRPHMLDHWREVYGVDVDSVDISARFCAMLRAPEHGYGKVLNPCVDCKILMMRETQICRELYDVRHVISGEVLGQRPMSQRRDTLNVIRRDSGLGDYLLRPLSGRLLPPGAAEKEGLLRREGLHDIAGRGRTKQMLLAERYGITEIPTPAGGCRLTERENARRYFMVLEHRPDADAQDFALANEGRQLWATPAEGAACWLSIGRNSDDNARLEALSRYGDVLLSLPDFPSPVGLARGGAAWSGSCMQSAAALTTSFAPHAVRAGGAVRVVLRDGAATERVIGEMNVTPQRESAHGFSMPAWEDIRDVLRARMRAVQGQ